MTGLKAYKGLKYFDYILTILTISEYDGCSKRDDGRTDLRHRSPRYAHHHAIKISPCLFSRASE